MYQYVAFFEQVFTNLMNFKANLTFPIINEYYRKVDIEHFDNIYIEIRATNEKFIRLWQVR